MPGFLTPSRTLTRRSVLGALAVAATSKAAETAKWAWLSDTHLAEDVAETYRGFRVEEMTRRAVQGVLRSDVSAAMINGDLARLKGLPGDYAMLARLMTPLSEKLPVAMTLGNHDDRQAFQQGVAQKPGSAQPVTGKHVSVLETGGWRWILLDSLLSPNITPGQLGKAQRTWLKEYLDRPATAPAILFVHHTLDDNDGSLVDADALLSLVRGKKAVKAIVYGHSHTYKLDHAEGCHLINLPAVGYNFADREPTGWLEVHATREGATLTLHATGGNVSGNGQKRSIHWR